MKDLTPQQWNETTTLLQTRTGEPFPHVSYAQFIINLCGDEIRYVPELKQWMRWTGSIWKLEPDEYPASHAIDTAITALMRQGSVSTIPQASQIFTSFVRSLLNAGHRSGVISAMKNIHTVRVSVLDLNANPDLIVCPNKTLNLRTGESYESRPEDLMTRMIKVPYDADADQTLWTTFLNQCHPGNQDRVQYLQTLMGYALTGHTSEGISAFFYGGGANGKGVFTGSIEYLMGEFSTTMPTDFWVKQYGGRNGAVLGKLDGPRLCVSNEMSGQKLDEEFYKDITDAASVACNPKYATPYDFTPRAFILWSGNERPKIVNTDDSIWRRLKLIPWEESFTGKRGDPKLKARLREEKNLQGILAWLVAGARQWYLEGLPESESIVNATEEYRKDSNPNYVWARTVFQEDENGFVSNKEILAVGSCGLNRPHGKEQSWPKSVAASFPGAILKKFRGERGVWGIRAV